MDRGQRGLVRHRGGDAAAGAAAPLSGPILDGFNTAYPTISRVLLDRGEGGLALWAALDPAGPRADALIELMLERNVNLDATLAVFAGVQRGGPQRCRAARCSRG